MTRILSISAFYHDSAAALVEDGEIVAAAQEERFTGCSPGPSGVEKNELFHERDPRDGRAFNVGQVSAGYRFDL